MLEAASAICTLIHAVLTWASIALISWQILDCYRSPRTDLDGGLALQLQEACIWCPASCL